MHVLTSYNNRKKKNALVECDCAPFSLLNSTLLQLNPTSSSAPPQACNTITFARNGRQEDMQKGARKALFTDNGTEPNGTVDMYPETGYPFW